MAVRRFNGAGDFLTFAVGNLVGINAGAFTIAALVKKEADGGFFPMVSAEATTSSRRSLWTTSGDVLMSNTGGFNIVTPVSFAQADGWAVVVVGKAVGEVLTRGHKGVIGGAWTHVAGDAGFDDGAIVDNAKIGTWQDGAHWPGLIGAVAMWKRQLSDVEIEMLSTGATAWVATAPDGMWLLNQTSTDTAVLDVTGNGADQTAIDGTTVELGDDPPGFSFDIDVVNALLNPSLFGWPDETNTGTTGALTPSGPLVITTPGAVIEDLDISDEGGGLAVEVRANNVVIRNCRIAATPAAGGGCIKQVNNATGLVVEDCELLYDAAGSYDACVGESDYTLRRCHIHHVSEGPRVGSNTTIQDCYIHTLLVDDPDAHADAVQSTGGTNMIIDHNTIVADQEGADFANAALILGAEFEASSNLTVSDCLLDGGGFTLFMGPSFDDGAIRFPMSGVTVTGNRFGRAAEFGPTSIGDGITALTASGNVFDNDNTEVAIESAPVAPTRGTSGIVPPLVATIGPIRPLVPTAGGAA